MCFKATSRKVIDYIGGKVVPCLNNSKTKMS